MINNYAISFIQKQNNFSWIPQFKAWFARPGGIHNQVHAGLPNANSKLKVETYEWIFYGSYSIRLGFLYINVEKGKQIYPRPKVS